MAERTKVQLAQTQSRSLRTTIPIPFARQLGIEEGTWLGWELKANGGGWFLVVRVAEPPEEEKPPAKRRVGAKGARR